MKRAQKPRPHALCASCGHERTAHDMPVENRGYNGCADFNCQCWEFVEPKRRRRRSTSIRRPAEAQKRYGYSRHEASCTRAHDCPDCVWFRSKVERDAAALLDALGITWDYEPTTFKLADGSSYTPDFLVPAMGERRIYVELHRLENDDPRDAGRKRSRLPAAAREIRRATGCPLLVLGEAAMREVVRLRKALAPDAEARYTGAREQGVNR